MYIFSVGPFCYLNLYDFWRWRLLISCELSWCCLQLHWCAVRVFSCVCCKLFIVKLISVKLVCCNNGMNGNILATLNNFDVGFAGTTLQLYAINPYWFYNSYIICNFFCRSWFFQLRRESRCIPNYLTIYFCWIVAWYSNTWRFSVLRSV